MITKNFKRIHKDILQHGGTSYSSYSLKDSKNATVYAIQEQPNLPTHQLKVSKSISEDGIIIGSSNQAESENDYWLKNQITSGFTSVVIPHHKKDQDENHILVFYVTITNTGETDLVINEIGYACITPVNIPKSPSWIGVSYNKGLKNILIDRTVLENPVTIEPNESKTIGYSLKTIANDDLPSASGISF